MSLGRLAPFTPGNATPIARAHHKILGQCPSGCYNRLQCIKQLGISFSFLFLEYFFFGLGPNNRASVLLPTSHCTLPFCLPDTEHVGIGTYTCSDDNNFDFAPPTHPLLLARCTNILHDTHIQ